jgi:mono/diheme cytochrome c family protein
MKRALLMLAIAIALLVPGARAQQASYPTPAWNRTTAADQSHGSLTERGAAVFNNWCSMCHGKDVKNAPGTRSLQFKYQGKLPAALEDRRDLTAEIVKLYVRKGVATMPFFRKTEISDADLDALAAYLSQAKR